MRKYLLIVLMLSAAAGSVSAQQMPPPPPGPPPGPPVPSAEELATIPNLSTAQQIELRKILVQRRDADEDAHDKLREQMQALHAKQRAEHERIDTQTSEQVRKLLGEEGFRTYAEWTLQHRHGPHQGMAPGGGREGGPGAHGLPPHEGPGHGPAAPPPGPGAGAGAPDDEG